MSEISPFALSSVEIWLKTHLHAVDGKYAAYVNHKVYLLFILTYICLLFTYIQSYICRYYTKSFCTDGDFLQVRSEKRKQEKK